MKADILFDLFFTELPIEERIERITAVGWCAIETWKGGDAGELKTIGEACRANGAELVSIVMNFANEADVAPVQTDRLAAFLERVDRYSDHALAAGCTSGIVTSGERVSGRDYYRQKQSLIEALSRAAEIANRKGFLLNLEPLNDKVDHPGYFLTSRDEALDIVRRVNSQHVKVLYDLYHEQIMGGDHIAFLEANIDWVGHFHAAGVPGRHEIFTGEMDYANVVSRIRDAGYARYLGLEYMPQMDHAASLRATLDYLAPVLEKKS